MRILKPEKAFMKFSCVEFYLDKFDICKFADSLCEGEFNRRSAYHLETRDYNGKHYYDCLPRCVRFNLSEREFCNLRFGFDSWYDYGFDKNEIYKDYCEEFFKFYESKKVLNFYKKLKKEYPELFI